MRVKILFLVFCLTSAVSTGSHAAEDEDCPIPPGIRFLPTTVAPTNRLPPILPGKDLPSDCEFYRWAWQTFLYVTDRGKVRSRFLEYSTFEDVFKLPHSPLFARSEGALLSLAPRTAQYPNKSSEPPAEITDLEQALSEKVLIDLHGNPVWYQIHLNPTFSEFVSANDLTNLVTLKNIPTDLEFRTGSVELKSAWTIIDGPNSDFITADALVPVFKKDPLGKVTRDGTKTRQVKVALISLHVVGVIDGHPEFIWATFEHTSRAKNKDGLRIRDVAPSADASGQKVINDGIAYHLYPGTTKGSVAPLPGANDGAKLADLALNPSTQKFSPVSAIYRIFPFSVQKAAAGEDPAIVSLNRDVQKAFDGLQGDVRRNYSLVAAVWLNKPRNDFQVGTSYPPDPADKFQGFGGEDGLSNMAIESFTQPDAPNCFSCHDTNSDRKSGLMASRLSVSHVLSKYFKAALKK